MSTENLFFFKNSSFFFVFFPGRENGGIRGENALWLDRPAPWALAPRRTAVEWGRQGRQPGAERTAEGY